MTPTPNQQRAISETGNLLVLAAAGAGKTGTLVQRCLRLLLREPDPVPVRRILIVTFTEAAAAEVRERVREALEKAAAQNPANLHLQEHLANLDSAHISTLHSFCFQLVRRHVLELGLDPAVSVLEAHESKLQFEDTLDTLFREQYDGSHALSAETKQLIQQYYSGWAQPLRDFVERLHEFTQTRPNPQHWFSRTLQELEQAECPRWHAWLQEAILDWCQSWPPYLDTLPPENAHAHRCSASLKKAFLTGDTNVPAQILAEDLDWARKKEQHRKPFAKLFEEAAFFDSLQPRPEGKRPLDEDWEWMRRPLVTIVKFAAEFARRFRADKFERGVLDFHDLEQLSLELLVDPTGGPTSLAQEWQQKFEAIFVDEYQDINAAQDLILTALSRPAAPGNRFLVGDIKQSIYRFRQADPSIFQRYLQLPGWTTILLSENFRSHESLLDFVNPLFGWLMHPGFGGLEYTAEAALKFGAPEHRTGLKLSANEPPHVELHLLLTGEQQKGDEKEEEPEIENAEVEARAVARRFKELKESGFTIYDARSEERRPVDWKDMVVLLRAARNRLETYAKAFAAEGVPLQTKRNAFFTTQEVLDLCNILTILDNPLQDIPLAAVLRSPIAGLTANELASIRIHSKAKEFWRALNDVYNRKIASASLQKIEKFLKQYHRWRNTRRCSSLAQRLELILADTGYSDWLLAQPRGRERCANVQQLVRVARKFDEWRGESLYLFLRYLEQLQNVAGDIEPAVCVEENSVRLMTVHQSKGLEFPIVALADLGKRFNVSDQQSGVMIHDRYRLCSMIKQPHTGQRYPSLPLWLARRSERREAIGEEMRVLYVALTRAQNHLLLFGSCPKSTVSRWQNRAQENLLAQHIFQYWSWLDWLGVFATLRKRDWVQNESGILDTFSYRVHVEPPEVQSAAAPVIAPRVDLSTLGLEFNYAHEPATRQSAKTSVTALRRKSEDTEEETASLFIRWKGVKGGTERGLATHRFIEHLSLSDKLDLPELRTQADALVENGLFTPEEVDSIDLDAVANFWQSTTGRDLLKHSEQIVRELPFTFRAAAADLAAAGLGSIVTLPENEFLIIQGVADLVLLAPKEIWLIDFKTDRLENKDLPAARDRYRPQILLYATALSAIYRRPVTRKGIFFLSLARFEWFETQNTASPAFEQLQFRM